MGWLSTIDRFTDPKSGVAYYMARVTVATDQMIKLNYTKISAGMPVDVVFKTGERSLLNYLLKPLKQRAFMGMKES